MRTRSGASFTWLMRKAESLARAGSTEISISKGVSKHPRERGSRSKFSSPVSSMAGLCRAVDVGVRCACLRYSNELLLGLRRPTGPLFLSGSYRFFSGWRKRFMWRLTKLPRRGTLFPPSIRKVAMTGLPVWDRLYGPFKAPPSCIRRTRGSPAKAGEPLVTVWK